MNLVDIFVLLFDYFQNLPWGFIGAIFVLHVITAFLVWHFLTSYHGRFFEGNLIGTLMFVITTIWIDVVLIKEVFFKLLK